MLIFRRVRQLKEQPYTQKDAEAAIGMTTDNGRPETMAIDQPAEEKQPEQAKQENDADDGEELDDFLKIY